MKVKEIKKLSRTRIGTIPKTKVIQNKKRFSRKNKRKEIEEQLQDYYFDDWR